MKNLINLLFYGKYNSKTYKKYKTDINKNNLKSLEVLCSINIIVGILLFILLFYTKSINKELMYYLFINILMSAGGIVLLKRNVKINSAPLLLVCYIYIIATMGIYKLIAISFDLNALIPLIAVMYIVNSFLFIDNPIRYNFIMFVFTIWLCSVTEINEFVIVNYFIYLVIFIIGAIISCFKFNTILEDSKILRQVKKERDLDMLTKLYNRGACERIISESLLSDPLGSVLIIFDLDNFKEVNDTYGHDEGDKVLIKVSDIIRNVFRKNDILVRLGGDEFIIFIDEDSDKSFIKSRAERLIKEIKNIKYNRKSIVGCSIGIAFSKREDDFNSLYKKADLSLYESKHRGKGCYTFYKDISKGEEK